MKLGLAIFFIASVSSSSSFANPSSCRDLFKIDQKGKPKELISQLSALREQIEEARIGGQTDLARLLYGHYQTLINAARADGIDSDLFSANSPPKVFVNDETEKNRIGLAKLRERKFTDWFVASEYPVHPSNRAVRVSPSKDLILISGNTLKVLDLRDEKTRVFPNDYGSILKAFDVNWRMRVVSVLSENLNNSSQAYVRFFSFEDASFGKAVSGFPEKSKFSVFDQTGQTAAHLIENKIVIQEMGSKKILKSFRSPWRDLPKALRFSPDGSKLIKTDHFEDDDVFDLNSGRLITRNSYQPSSNAIPSPLVSLFRRAFDYRDRFHAHISANRIALTQDKDLFAIADESGKGWMQSRNLGRVELLTGDESISRLQFSPNEDILFVTLKSGTLLAFEVATGTLLRGVPDVVKSFDMSDDQSVFVYLSGDKLVIEKPRLRP